MESKDHIINEKGLSINIVVREEDIDGKKVVIVNNEELGVADFGDNLNDAIKNFRKSARMYLDTYPEKKKLLEEKEPLLVSRIFL
mgnify:FL=1